MALIDSQIFTDQTDAVSEDLEVSDQESGQEVFEDGEDSIIEDPEVSDQESDQEAFEDVVEPGDDEFDGGENYDDVLHAGDDLDSVTDDSETDTGSSGIEDQEVEDLQDVTDDLGLVSEGHEEVSDFDFEPEYYISDGILYSSDGVALDRDVYVLPASVTSSTAVYTPQAWQVNLAENRRFGDHYLMWAQRVQYATSSYYWRYYLALGPGISRTGDSYRYQDVELYTYYSYNSQVVYDVSVSSGTVSGSSYLVYSDLYFDYVGVDPAGSGLVYITFIMFVIVIALLMIGGKRNV